MYQFFETDFRLLCQLSFQYSMEVFELRFIYFLILELSQIEKLISFSFFFFLSQNLSEIQIYLDPIAKN